MRSFIVSTLVFIPASFFLNRYLEEWGLDKGRTRALSVMLLASIIAYGVAFIVEWIFG